MEFMEEMKVKRLKRELDELHAARRKISVDAVRAFKKTKITENFLMPSRVDFWQFEPIKEIINAPPDVNVTVSSFDDAILEFPKLIDEWRQSIARRMTSIIKGILGDEKEVLCYDEFSEEYFHKTNKIFPNANLSEDQLLAKLSLASTVFRCQRCRPQNNWCDSGWDSEDWQPSSIPLFYPHVLGHHCLTTNPISFFYDDPYEQPRYKHGPAQIWLSTE